ncbi:TolB family protein [Flagellimonas myxillae]|uniref:TolB family protein n=1 Tax=Flagellimonas myxillae TaxID=2942214 RepID=UPI00201F6C29|nr:hypothetical protein [Muricauda myxillae]MCL6265850.1 hypothetical protein [Muricauda myxillae]
MYRINPYFWQLCFAATLFLGCKHQKETSMEQPTTIQNHPYISDSIGNMPVKFQPEVVSTQIDKFNTSLSPDGKIIYYTATSQKLGVTGIAYQHFENGHFSPPSFVPFVSAQDPIADVQISPDGNLMLFSSSKEFEGKAEGFNFNIWSSELKNGIWQEPVPMGTPIASSGNEFYPVMTNNRTIYFNSDKSGNSDIYFSRYANGTYQEPVRLPDNLNSVRTEADAFVSPDESYIIFVRIDESDGFGNSDLYISFRKGENIWSDPINMGAEVNSDLIDGSPYVTPDGNYLIFTTGRLTEGVKEKAVKNYGEFKSIATSSDNGSLNFYIMKLDLNNYRRTFLGNNG